METKFSVNQRFIKAVNYLLKVKSVKNKSELAANLRLGKSKLSEILNERMNVGIDTIALFCLLYEIRTDWILNEKGKMVRPDQFIPKENDLFKIYLENVENVNHPENLNYKELADARLEIIEFQKEKIAKLEKDLSEFRCNSQKEPVLYRTVAEPSLKLSKKQPK